jgi:hypothetical protein
VVDEPGRARVHQPGRPARAAQLEPHLGEERRELPQGRGAGGVERLRSGTSIGATSRWGRTPACGTSTR